MVYLTHYEEYPIYEPAEGGYYYAGVQVTEYERLSLRQAKKQLKNLWEEAQRENENLDEKYKWHMTLPWRNERPQLVRFSKYIGEGESYVIERKLGSQERGWEPYC